MPDRTLGLPTVHEWFVAVQSGRVLAVMMSLHSSYAVHLVPRPKEHLYGPSHRQRSPDRPYKGFAKDQSEGPKISGAFTPQRRRATRRPWVFPGHPGRAGRRKGPGVLDMGSSRSRVGPLVDPDDGPRRPKRNPL